MPRDSGGTYSLPAGNPVVTLTVISSTWANTTLSDISTALTGSLDRSGQGAMLAGLKLFDGTIGAPGLTWGTETTSGIYRNAAGDFRFAIAGVDVWRFATGGSIGLFGNGTVGAPGISWVSEPTSGMYRAGAADFRWALAGVDFMQWTTNLESISGTAPARRWNETDAAANNRLWDAIATGEDFHFRALTDALVATNWMSVTRTAGVVDLITLASTAVTVTGQATFTNNGPGIIIDRTAGAPSIRINEGAAAANNRLWDEVATGEALLFRAINDAVSVFTTWMQVDRTGTTIDTINFPNGVLQYAGLEVGFRNMARNDQNGNYTLLTGDRAGSIIYGGGGGHTYTLPVGLALGIFTIINFGTGTLTLSASTPANLAWANGSGVISTGNRTLAIAGIATVWSPSSGNWYVWGTGLT